MTDKKEFDQKELHVAFEQLNETDALQPSADLDAMILQMAADEVPSDSTEEDKSNVTDISDISFRRGQRESHTSLKQKGMFPKWIMPMGLAATVLLSFGVVNRVLLSPEFEGLTKQSSYEAMSDEVIVTSDLDSKVQAKKEELRLSKPESPEMKRLRSSNADAKITLNGNEMNADISFADAPIPAPAEPPPVVQNKGSSLPGAIALETRSNAKELSEVEYSSAELERDLHADREKRLTASRQEQHALSANKKREQLTQLRRRVEPEIQMAPVPMSTAQKTNAEASMGNVAEIQEVIAMGAREDKNTIEDSATFIESEALSSLGEAVSIEEVIVSNSIKNDTDTSDYKDAIESVSTDKLADTNLLDLQSVLFEHKQCQVKQDCALLAQACDTCDCLEPVSNEHYKKYQSEFSETEIAEQCTNTSVECVRNYCQIQESE